MSKCSFSNLKKVCTQGCRLPCPWIRETATLRKYLLWIYFGYVRQKIMRTLLFELLPISGQNWKPSGPSANPCSTSALLLASGKEHSHPLHTFSSSHCKMIFVVTVVRLREIRINHRQVRNKYPIYTIFPTKPPFLDYVLSVRSIVTTILCHWESRINFFDEKFTFQQVC